MELLGVRTRIHTASEDESCILLFHDDRLFACLTQLDCSLHREFGGCWYVESLFGAAANPESYVFTDLDDAVASVTTSVFGRPMKLERPLVGLEPQTESVLPIRHDLKGHSQH